MLFNAYDKKYGELNVYSSFSNIEPSYLSQEPQILTTWGNEKIELLKCHKRNYNRHNEYTEYYEAIGWEKQ
jgi:hypothetical protein